MTPKTKIDLGSKQKSLFSKEYEDHVAQVKKEQFAKDRDFFDICDPMSSAIFDKREKLIKKHWRCREVFKTIDIFKLREIRVQGKTKG